MKKIKFTFWLTIFVLCFAIDQSFSQSAFFYGFPSDPFIVSLAKQYKDGAHCEGNFWIQTPGNYTFRMKIRGTIETDHSKLVGLGNSIYISCGNYDLHPHDLNKWSNLTFFNPGSNGYYTIGVHIDHWCQLTSCDNLIIDLSIINNIDQEIATKTLTYELHSFIPSGDNDEQNMSPQKISYSFNYADLFMRDDDIDLGAEPNWNWWDFNKSEFSSPDLWVRLYPDGGTDHENPQYATKPGNNNRVYYRIFNRGCLYSNDASLRLYWSFARIDEEWSRDWLYDLGLNYVWNRATKPWTRQPAGGEITIQYINDYSSQSQPIPIQSTHPAYNIMGYHNWIAPDPSKYEDPSINHKGIGKPVICFLARIESSNNWDLMVDEQNPAKIFDNVYKNNNIVTRNTFYATTDGTYIVGPIDNNYYSRYSFFYLGNNSEAEKVYNIGFINASIEQLPNITNYANIYIYLDNRLFNIWANQNYAGSGYEIVEQGKIKVTNPDSLFIDSLLVNPDSNYEIGIQFEYFDHSDSNLTYKFIVGSFDRDSNCFIGSPIIYFTDILATPSAIATSFDLLEILESQDTMLRIFKKVKNVNCFGGSEGIINIDVSGGVPPYSYSWSNYDTAQSISGLVAGTYILTVTDSNNYQIIDTIIITQPTSLSISGIVQNVNCSDSINGAIDLTISGGIQPYSSFWSDSSIIQNISGLIAGTYIVNVTDSNGCSISDTFNVTLLSAIDISNSVTDASCIEVDNGAIDLSVSGGVIPYSYLWSNNANTQDISGLSSGTYSVIVTDSVGCVKYDTANISILLFNSEIIADTGNPTKLVVFVNNSFDTIYRYHYSWSPNGDTTNIIYIAQSVTFSVIVTDPTTNCTTSDDIFIPGYPQKNSISGIHNVGLSIYPNPVIDYLCLNISNIDTLVATYSMVLNNKLGQKIFSTDIILNKGAIKTIFINFSKLAPELYILTTYKNGIQVNKEKIIKI